MIIISTKDLRMFSNACKYGIRAVLYLALKSSETERIGVAEIADKLEVPKHFLAKILQQLVKGELISSLKGPGGGFYLTTENKKSNLKKVIEVIDGPDFFTACVLGYKECSSKKPCPFHTQAYGLKEGLSYQLEYQTIEEQAEKIIRKKISI